MCYLVFNQYFKEIQRFHRIRELENKKINKNEKKHLNEYLCASKS